MDLVFESLPVLLTGVFIFGALIGSFLNVVILRVPSILDYDWRCQCSDLLELDEKPSTEPPGIITTRSKCPHCSHNIRPWENIPIISYLFLRGKCSSCHSRISPRYPLVECTTALLFVLCIWHFGPNLQGLTALILTAFLIAATGIDIDHQLLPDNFTLPLMWLGILLAIQSVHVDLQSSVIGAAAGYLALWTVFHVFRILTGKEGMGYGDFKLLAALGAWMGWQMLPLIILLSSVVGALVGLVLMGTGKLQRDKPMPFGPFIAAAGWIALIWGEKIISVYSRTRGFG